MQAKISNQSVLTKHQTKEYSIKKGNKVIVCNIRYDDKCGNGHNTFAMTGEVWERTRKRNYENWDLKEIDGLVYELTSCGCIHDILKRNFPQYAHLIKWHLVSSISPMHYKANAQYWAKAALKAMQDITEREKFLKNMRNAVVSEMASTTNVLNDEWLQNHLDNFMIDFKKDIEAIGFKF